MQVGLPRSITYPVLDYHTYESIVNIPDYCSQICISLVLAIATIVDPDQH